MKLLALDTTVEACSVALLDEGEISEKFAITPRKHTDYLLPMMEALLSDSHVKLDELSGIAFACGPGSFTGIRIATSVAQGLAVAADIPLIKISSLAAMAQGAYRLHEAKSVLAGFDARMSQIYWGAYQLDEHGFMRVVQADSVTNIEDIPLIEGKGWLGVGSAWQSYEDNLKNQLGFNVIDTVIPDFYPNALDIITLAQEAVMKGETVAPEEALPSYLRENVVQQKHS